MGVLVGGIIGFIVGLVISNAFIFPADVLSLKLANLTIGDVLRIIGGIAAILIAAWIGWFIGDVVEES